MNQLSSVSSSRSEDRMNVTRGDPPRLDFDTVGAFIPEGRSPCT